MWIPTQSLGYTIAIVVSSFTSQMCCITSIRWFPSIIGDSPSSLQPSPRSPIPLNQPLLRSTGTYFDIVSFHEWDSSIKVALYLIFQFKDFGSVIFHFNIFFLICPLILLVYLSLILDAKLKFQQWNQLFTKVTIPICVFWRVLLSLCSLKSVDKTCFPFNTLRSR